MPKQSKYYGKLSPECLVDLDALLIKLRQLNQCHAGKRIIPRNEIVPLPENEYLRLWGYLRHCCLLATNWKNIKDAISCIADKSGRTFEEVQEECIDSMTIHVYTYAWRHYEHSEECGYVFTTAEFGYRAWIEEQNKFHKGVDAALEQHEDRNNCGRKVFTQNIHD